MPDLQPYVKRISNTINTGTIQKILEELVLEVLEQNNKNS